MKSADALDLITMLPLMAAERPQGDIGRPFQVQSEFQPAGDQPQAIDGLCQGLKAGDRDQVLLGVTGSGKTFTMAHVIERTARPAIILAPNKTLAAQLYGEMKSFFPENAVEYFVSYYDYYQPEAYVPRTDTYVEKESSLNEQIDRMRHSATRAILERRDVVVVASVSCIYGIGSVETYSQMTETLTKGDRINRNQLLARFVELQYRRNDHNFFRGSFRVRGDTIELFPAHYEDRAWRISLFGDEIEAVHEIDPLTGEKTASLLSVKIYANSHYVTPRPTLLQAIEQIKRDLKIRLDEFVRDTRHDPRGRRLAYELIAKVDPSAPDRIIPGMLDDPSVEFRRDAVARGAPRDAVIERLNEEHGIIDLSRCDTKPALGEQIAIVPNHVCVVSNLHDEVVLSRDGRVVDTWRVAARGRTR